MTLRTRNNFNLLFSGICTAFLLFNIIFLIYEIKSGTFNIPAPSIYPKHSSFIFAYNPICPIISMFAEMIFSVIAFYLLYSIFEKTQASEIIYLAVFIFAVGLDSIRFWLILFDMAFTYSDRLIVCQNLIIFAKVIAPLAMMLLVTMSEPEQRQNIEKNIFIIFIVSLLFGIFIPINTGSLLPNFSCNHAYHKGINSSIVILTFSSLLLLISSNNKKGISHKVTIGFGLMEFGFQILSHSISIAGLILGVCMLYSGTFLYLKSMHNVYLWNYS